MLVDEAPSEERKVATVLFADLVGSTELAGQQDAERTRARLNRFYDAMAAEIAEAGGTIEKFIGDAVNVAARLEQAAGAGRGMISDSSDPSASDPTTEHAALQPFQAEKRLTKCLCGLTRATAGKPAVVCAYRGNKNMRVCRSFTGATGLEPATSGVTGRRSNQLNYAPGDGEV